LSSNSDSEGRTEPLEIRRPVELPEVDTESADDLTPASGTGPEDDRSASGAAAEVSADSGDADPASEDAQEAEPRTRPEDASPSGNEEQNLVSAQEEVAPSGAGADKGDGTPPDRPKKPILAAVAIGGAVLLAIPVLLIGTGSHDDKKHRSAAAADNVLPGAGQQPPPGAFVSTSPSVTPTPSASASPKGKSKATAKASAKKGSTAGVATLAHSGGSGVPTGPKFSTVTRLLIKNVMTGLCADVPGYGNGGLTTPINQFTCRRSNDNQLWDLVVNDKGAGPHGADLFTIRNSMDNYCFDLPGTGAVDGGTHVTENLCYPGLGDNQMWYLDKRSSHSFWIRNYVIHKWCLDVLGTAGAGGKDAALTVVQCDPKDDHLWSFS
jgi:hypothetical protein